LHCRGPCIDVGRLDDDLEYECTDAKSVSLEFAVLQVELVSCCQTCPETVVKHEALLGISALLSNVGIGVIIDLIEGDLAAFARQKGAHFGDVEDLLPTILC